jgi:hypothetical protein
MIILHDNIGNTDLSHIQAKAAMDEGFSLFDYVSIKQTDDKEWIGQIVQPNQNISIVGNRLDPTILHGLNLMQSHSNVQSVESVQVFDILILGLFDDGRMTTPRLRPLPGSVVEKLSVEITRNVIEIPGLYAHDNGKNNIIGKLMNADDVPLCVTEHLFNYHFMVAGGTGCGKSNVSANLVTQALSYQKCVLIHDAKPDYNFADRPNSDNKVKKIWDAFKDYGLLPYKPDDIIKVGFYKKCDHNKVDMVVGFNASDFEPDILAGFFFTNESEQLQYEGFAYCTDYTKQNRQDYSIDDILQEVDRRRGSSDGNIRIADATVQAIKRKVNWRRKEMPWLDVVGKNVKGSICQDKLGSSLTRNNDEQKNVEKFETSIFNKGRLIIIDYSRMDPQSYALILSYFLRTCHNYRKERGNTGIVQLVDEAHRIFDNTSKHGDALAAAFGITMREGRSVDHSLIVSLQNASQIPHRIMNNLNSKIVMRQNSKQEAKDATQTMGDDYAIQSMRLGTGHALVSLFESKAVVFVQMAPSPFELMRNDNTKQEEE